jgi:hypothetical protein
MEYNLIDFYYEVLYKRYELNTLEEYNNFKIYVSEKLYYLILNKSIAYITFRKLDIKIIIDENMRDLEYGYNLKEKIIDKVNEFFE